MTNDWETSYRLFPDLDLPLSWYAEMSWFTLTTSLKCWKILKNTLYKLFCQKKNQICSSKDAFSRADQECVNFLLSSVRYQESARVGLESETNSYLVTSLYKQTSGNCNQYVPAVTTAFTHAASADPVSSYMQIPTEWSTREKSLPTHHVTNPVVLPAHLFAFLQIILQ